MDMYSWVFPLFATCLPTAWLVDQKALEEFVKLPDSHYKYTFLNRIALPAFPFRVNIDTINMISQKWLNESEVDKPVWRHELTLFVNRRGLLEDSCLLEIRPGDPTENGIYPATDWLLAAEETNTVVAVLRLVPFQPLTFYNHPLGHTNITGLEIFAYSWWRFMNDSTAPPDVLVEFPMVKAIVRAMDTITDYVKKKYRHEVKRYSLKGVSMGGWVSWLAAAVDQRIESIVPIGMDFLNFTESFHHQYRSYCGWSYMMRPFYELNITQELDSPRFSELASHVDPMAYNEQCANVTKYILVFSGDEFSQIDNLNHYFPRLKGVKYLLILPNHDHGYNFISYIVTFYYKMAYKKSALPNISWEIKMTNTSGSIVLRAYNVYQVLSYHADTIGGTRRDFRMRIAAGNSTKKNPVKWIQTDVWEEMHLKKRTVLLESLCYKIKKKG